MLQVMKSQRSKSLHEAEDLVLPSVFIDHDHEKEIMIINGYDQVGIQLREEQEIPGKHRSVSFNGVIFIFTTHRDELFIF